MSHNPLQTNAAPVDSSQLGEQQCVQLASSLYTEASASLAYSSVKKCVILMIEIHIALALSDRFNDAYRLKSALCRGLPFSLSSLKITFCVPHSGRHAMIWDMRRVMSCGSDIEEALGRDGKTKAAQSPCIV